LILGIDGETDRPQLHLDDRMMAVTPLGCGGQTGQVLGFDMGKHSSPHQAGVRARRPTPRVIACAEEFPQHIALPRG